MTQVAYVAGQLPRLNLQDLPADAVVLCTTPRLARDLRLEYNRLQATAAAVAGGLSSWATLQASLLPDWLAGLMEQALLAGRLFAAGLSPARRVLSKLQERLLWQQAIGAVEGEDAAQPLLDVDGLARLAQEAHELLQVWRLPLSVQRLELSQETQQFLRWQVAYLALCAQHQAQDAAAVLSWQLQALAQPEVVPAHGLPSCVVLAGFDRFSPQEEQLCQVLAQRGVAVYELAQGLSEPVQAVVLAQAELRGECQAAVAWVVSEFAAARAAGRPLPRLGLVVPDLAALRLPLAALLDDALHPESLVPSQAEMARLYNFSLGTALATQPLVHAALQWLETLAAPWSLELLPFLNLLRSPWGCAPQDRDARARLEMRLRRQLPARCSLQRLQQQLSRQPGAAGAAAAALAAQLQAAQAWLAEQPKKAPPGQWAVQFHALLLAVGWPGGRSLSSHEFQARQALLESLEVLAGLDGLLGKLTLATALRQLRQICQERIFQPQTEGDPPLQIMGLLETAGTAFDALWVMGMNDHVWPPAARPSPLLPAQAQRVLAVPNASATVQEAFARRVQARLMRSAPRVIFSWARMEGDRELRPTPLLAGLPAVGEEALPAHLPGLMEQLASLGQSCEALDDSQAPAVAASEVVSGGANLLRTQALCPAWAYYRYRLQAVVPDTPLEGLDERQRGSLLHAVLQTFWQCHGAQGAEIFRLWDAAQLAQAIAAAVHSGLQAFMADLPMSLSVRQQALEQERLQQLLQQWLAVEAERGQAFEVLACEAQHELNIAGLTLKLRSDRIDRLADGRQVVIDYKTGGQQALRGWLGERLSEPQLPLYAALVLPQLSAESGQLSAAPAQLSAASAQLGDVPAHRQVAALGYARVRAEDCAFVGVSDEAGVLPGVQGMEKQRTFKDYGDWAALLRHWQTALTNVAGELREGVAAVRFASDRDVQYCDVLPLLRLSERREQMLAAGLFVEGLELDAAEGDSDGASAPGEAS